MANDGMTSVEYLRSVGSVFVRNDWTFETGDAVVDVVYKDVVAQNTLVARVKRAWYWLYVGGHSSVRSAFGDGVRHRVGMAFHSLRRQTSEPDGYLQDGGIVTQWCEDGEYIELVQPSVGLLVADFLDAEPENEHALKIRAELDRIYAKKKWHSHGAPGEATGMWNP